LEGNPANDFNVLDVKTIYQKKGKQHVQLEIQTVHSTTFMYVSKLVYFCHHSIHSAKGEKSILYSVLAISF